MPTARLLSAVALASLASPAAAQLSNHAIAVETGVSRPLGGGAGSAPVLALAASTWLDGPVEGMARLEVASAARTSGRREARHVSGTLGLRISLLPDPVRPQVSLELGWARVEESGGAADELAVGVGAGIEWFLARDVSLAARTAVRTVGAAMRVEVAAGLAAYFQ